MFSVLSEGALFISEVEVVYFVFLFEVFFMFLTEVMYFVFLGEVFLCF